MHADPRSGLPALRRRRARRGPRLAGHRAAPASGRCSAKRAFLGLLLVVVAAVPRARASRSTSRPTFRRRVPRADGARRSAQFLEQQDIFVFFVTVYVGAGLIANDRRANALQIYLSKPLTRAEYIFGKLAILMTFLLLVTWVPAIAAAVVQMRSPATSRSSAATCSCSRRSRVFAFIQVADGVVGDAGAVVAVEEQPLRRHPVRRRHLLHPGDLTACCASSPAARGCRGSRSPRNLAQIGDVIFRLPPRYDTPWPVSLLMIVVLIACRLWSSSAACAASRWSRDRAARRSSPPSTCRSGTAR